MDLSPLSKPELAQLQADVAAELKGRDEAAKADAKVRIQAIAAEVGVPLKELMADAASRAAKQTRTPVPVKFVNPDKPSDTWTGRGRAPLWAQKLKDANQLDRAKV